MKKLLVVGVIVLFLGLACAPSINANVSKSDEPIKINISAGYFGRDIGRGVTVEIVNENINESETVFVNLSFDSLFINSRDTNTSWIATFENCYWLHLGLGFRISQFYIKVEVGNTTVLRDGIIIYRLLILLN
jgi:hypothetical protein